MRSAASSMWSARTWLRSEVDTRESVDRLGREVAKEYDADGTLTAEVWTAGGVVTGGRQFTYDLAGEMTSAGNAVGTYTLGYDGAGRVSSVTGLFGLNLTFSYDGGGNRVGVADSGGWTTDN